MTSDVTAEAYPHIALVGLMASGKTSVGRVVADHLGRPLVDSDEVVEARTGMTVADLWRRGGEPLYRPHEREAVTQTLAGEGPDVLCVPAGAVDDEVAVAAMRRPGVFTVWLRADIDTLVRRLGHGDHRPLLDEDPRAVLEQQAADRADRYQALADLVLDVEDHDPEALGAAVIAGLPR